MLKHILIGVFTTLSVPTIAEACSCYCDFDHKVSEYLQTHKAFWGVPKQSQLTSDYNVISKVEVLEGYEQLNSGKLITIESQPEDGASCGTQLYTGVPQFIVASTINNKNIVSTCNCEPPSAYLIEYLKEGKDQYLPNLRNCWNDDSEVKPTEKCEIWRKAPDDDIAEFSELMRMHKLLREKQTAKPK